MHAAMVPALTAGILLFHIIMVGFRHSADATLTLKRFIVSLSLRVYTAIEVEAKDSMSIRIASLEPDSLSLKLIDGSCELYNLKVMLLCKEYVYVPDV